MLEQIIGEVNANEEQKKKPFLRRTTFGQIRIDRTTKSEKEKLIENLWENYDPNSEENRKFDERLWSQLEKDVKRTPGEIDFFGLNNAHHRNNIFEKDIENNEENFIDKICFPELLEKKKVEENLSKPLSKETIESLKAEDFNEIDEQYFGTLKRLGENQLDEKKNSSIKVERNENSSPKSISPHQNEEINYIDQLVFQNLKVESSEKMLNFDFKYRTEPKKEKPNPKEILKKIEDTTMKDFNPKLESIRTIKPKDYFEPPRLSALDKIEEEPIESAPTADSAAEQIRQSLTRKNSNRDTLGYRVFDNLIPQWSKMTKKEIVDVLVKQICFARDGILALDKPYGLPTIGGPNVDLSVAHFIPQIIERLNRPEIRQLHLLHRLDKGSTGVLLMAYSTEAEKRLRELMGQQKLIKQYLAIVRGEPSPHEGEIKIPIVEREVRGHYKMMLSPAYSSLTKLVLPKKNRENIESHSAVTKFRVLDSNYGVSLVECQPITGVKHQIRTHLANGLGTPILGDHKYSHYAKLAPQKLPIETLKKLGVRQAKVRTIPLCLHSFSVAIPNFLGNQQNIFIRARLSHHFRYFVKAFRLKMLK